MRWRIARSERESGTGSFRSRDGARLAAVAEANLPPAWPVDGHDETGSIGGDTWRAVDHAVGQAHRERAE